MAIAPQPLNTSQPKNQLQSGATVDTLSLADAQALLSTLQQERWPRLAVEYHDPLSMLFNQQAARQWTLGWDHDQEKLYLLIWESIDWEKSAHWSLYCNGRLLYQEKDGHCKIRSRLCQSLLESPQLPVLEGKQLLYPLTDFRNAAQSQQQAAHSLIQTLKARPEVFESLKAPLLSALEHDLNNPNWPLLDILKLHRVTHKLALLLVFDSALQSGWLNRTIDQQRLLRAVSQLENTIDSLKSQLALLFQPWLTQTCQTLNRLLQQQHWQALAKAWPVPNF